MKKMCLRIEELYKANIWLSNGNYINTSLSGKNPYFDLYDNMGQLVCSDGESCEVVNSENGYTTFCNRNGEYPVYFKLSNIEATIASFTGEKRLTTWNGEQWIENHNFDEKCGWKNGNQSCMEKLAAYENTHLEPEEIQQVVDIFGDIVNPEKMKKEVKRFAERAVWHSRKLSQVEFVLNDLLNHSKKIVKNNNWELQEYSEDSLEFEKGYQKALQDLLTKGINASLIDYEKIKFAGKPYKECEDCGSDGFCMVYGHPCGSICCSAKPEKYQPEENCL